MCDTIYFGGSRGKSPGAEVNGRESRGGRSFFGKNSDRKPEEPQYTLIIEERPPSSTVTISGNRMLEVPDSGYSCVISKPSWIWGAEMGINSRGVSLGNEAVFGKAPVDKKGILGMDILRLALQNSATAEEALEFILGFLEEFGQGGNGAYKGKLYYHNSFLISDPRGAYILETAGRQWAYKRIEGFGSISNAYSIKENFDRADPASMQRLEGGLSWKKAVEKGLFTYFSRGNVRNSASGRILAELSKGEEPPRTADFFSLLRSHNTYSPNKPNRKNMESLCIHGGGLLNNATTASMLVEYPLGSGYPEDPIIVWYTGTSYPCISLYKPIILKKGVFYPLCSSVGFGKESESGRNLWQAQRERIKKGAERLGEEPEFIHERDSLQERIIKAVSDYLAGSEKEAVKRINKTVEEFESLFHQFLGH